MVSRHTTKMLKKQTIGDEPVEQQEQPSEQPADQPTEQPAATGEVDEFEVVTGPE